jgi:hypothetical protein
LARYSGVIVWTGASCLRPSLIRGAAYTLTVWALADGFAATIAGLSVGAFFTSSLTSVFGMPSEPNLE